VYIKQKRLVRLAYRDRTRLCCNKGAGDRSKGINREGINLRFHEFCYGFCKEHPERIDNVKMILYCFLCYHYNTTGQVGNTLLFLDKGKENSVPCRA
jgi:hypothetical protein